MNLVQAILWGFVATIVLTTLLSGSRALGLTRMDIFADLCRCISQHRMEQHLVWSGHWFGACSFRLSRRNAYSPVHSSTNGKRAA